MSYQVSNKSKMLSVVSLGIGSKAEHLFESIAQGEEVERKLFSIKPVKYNDG